MSAFGYWNRRVFYNFKLIHIESIHTNGKFSHGTLVLNMGSQPEIAIETVVSATADAETSSSCDLERFCRPCLDVLMSTSPINARLHGTFQEIVECGETKCPFCLFICTSFGEHVRHEAQHRKRMPWVNIQTADYSSANGLVQELDMFVTLKDWGQGRERETDYKVGLYSARANGIRGLGRAIWSQRSPVSFATRKATIFEWLEECQTNHPKCRNTLDVQSPVAARMLEVRFEKGKLHIRLVSTQELQLQNPAYFVLSHCWGGIKIDAILTRPRLRQYHEDIKISTLPKTFREAIEITGALRCKYLWIDSLCIIQGDEEDWRNESRKMAAIFRGATLTISASQARNSTEGCGISNLLSPATIFTVNRKTEEKPAEILSLRQRNMLPVKDLEMLRLLQRSPVHERAWIFQEKILSRRILHATQSQFIWQCATHVESEDGIFHTKNEEGFSHREEVLRSHVPEHSFSPGFHHIQSYWWHWIDEYQKRTLTNPRDRYAAFAGVTELYRNITNDAPIFGLWARDLHIHLSWYARPGRTKSLLPVEPRVPSWTWMTFPHGSANAFCGSATSALGYTEQQRHREMKFRYEAKVLDYDIQWTGEPLVTIPARGTVKLRGLCDCILLPTNRNGGQTNMDPDFLSQRPDTKIGELYGCPFDVIFLYAYETDHSLITHPPILITVGLVLEVLDTAQKTYRRVGRVDVWKDLPSGTEVESVMSGTYQEIVLA